MSAEIPETIAAKDLSSLAGRVLAPSSWLEITQERVDCFADATDDHQFIHIDPEKAAETPFGGTIAHGFLTLSLLTRMAAETAIRPEGLVMVINYGSDKVRYLQAVRVGSRVRAHQQVVSATEKRAGQWLIKTQVSVEIENVEKPAMIGELLSMLIIK